MSAWRVRRPGPMSTRPLERVTVPVPSARAGRASRRRAGMRCVPHGSARRRRATCRFTGRTSIPGPRSRRRSRRAGPGHRRRVHRRRPRRHRMAAPHLRAVQVLHPRPGEPVPAVALHRLGRRRWIRRIRNGSSRFRSSATGRILRQRTGPAVVRGHHRLSLAVARRPACRRAAGNLRLRRQRAHHRPGGAWRRAPRCT